MVVCATNGVRPRKAALKVKFTETPLKGAFVIELEMNRDSRGFFARAFCQNEFTEHGLCADIVQINTSFNSQRGTLRGMHYQLAPKAEDKIVRCIRGRLFDAIIDLRKNSATFLQHFAIELSEENHRMLFVPKGFAHGFLTLEDNTEALYLVTAYYCADQERGIRYDDPKFAIPWPIEANVVSQKDSNHPSFDPAWHLG
jgi:dTDP-4-dehydrorhamnose 3,5-epimerase